MTRTPGWAMISAILGVGVICVAEEPDDRANRLRQSVATRPSDRAIDETATKLVLDIYQREAWIDQVNSVTIRAETRSTRSPESVKAQRAELVRMRVRIDREVDQKLMAGTTVSRSVIAFERRGPR